MALSVPVNPDNLLNDLQKLVKRHPYIKYSKYPQVVAKVIEILKCERRGDIPKISKHTKFKIRTLYNWAAALKKDPNFNPINKKTNQNRRIFTDAEEDAISDYIIENILMAGILFTDEDFEELIMQAFLEKHKDDPEDFEIPHFNASKGFIYDFKKNHGFVSRRCHTKRRPDNKKYDKTFCDAMAWVFSNVDPHYIVNVDETGWAVIPNNLRVWHMVGKDHVVRYVNGNDKDKVTVVASIAADGTKLPLQFIAKGETEAVLNTQIGDVGYHTRAYSSNGWTTIETFKQFLISVRDYYTWEDQNTIHLLLDVFKAHIGDEIYKLSKELNIKLYLIPAGMTDELQPLDKKIFGPMKTFARKLFRDRISQNPDQRRTKVDACADMVRAWERLTPDLIEESFEHLKDLERWAVEGTIGKINKFRHHREFCTASLEMKKLLSESDKYREI